MVKRILLLILIPVVFSSCAFFGASAFPLATSIDIGWFIGNGETRAFFILDNGEDDELLVLINQSEGNYRAIIFDTSLNLRGYLENGSDGVLIDDKAFIDHNGDFVIGQTKISRTGSTGSDEIEFVPVPFLYQNTGIIPYSDGTTNFYIRIGWGGDVQILDEEWNTGTNLNLPINDFIVIHQSDITLNDVILAQQSGNLYTVTKKALFDHAAGTLPITNMIPDTTITDTELTQWVTRCSRGYFVSGTNNRQYLFDFNGYQLQSVDSDDFDGEVVTIDYDCQYYYIVDRRDNVIRKVRFPD